jgi:hypothetical protein
VSGRRILLALAIVAAVALSLALIHLAIFKLFFEGGSGW